MKIQTCRFTALAAVVALAGTAYGQDITKTVNRQTANPKLVEKVEVKNTAGFGQRADATDSCFDAPEVAPGIHNYDLTGASNDYAGTCGATSTAEDVWLKFTAPENGELTVETCGLATADTVLALIDGCGGTTIVCNDDACSLQSRAIGVVAGGQTVYIRIADFGGGQHAGQVSVSFSPLGAGPENDDCANAEAINGTGTFAFDNRQATTDGVGDGLCLFFGNDNILQDLWFLWTAPADGNYSVETCTLASFDTKIAVYFDGSCGSGVLSCNDDACGLQSRAFFETTAGAQHLIRVGSYGAATGAGSILITGFTPIDNDFCADATDVGAGTHNYDLTGATNDYPGICGATGSAEDVWFRYTSGNTDEFVTVETCGLTGGDSVLSAIDGCGGSTIACNDDACGLQSRIQFVLAANTPVYIRVADFGGGVHSGAINISSQLVIAPENDDCVDATLVEAGVHAFDTSLSSTDGSASCGFGGDPGGRDVWFKFVAPSDAQAIVTTCGYAGFDTILSAYDNCNGTEVGCNDDACGLQSTIAFAVTQGATYYVRVSGYANAGGQGSIELSFAEPCEDFTQPPGSIAENEEGCFADINGGCNNAEGLVTAATYNSTIYGYAWAQGGTRDTDWYEFSFDGGDLMVTCAAEFPGRIFILDTNCAPTIIATDFSSLPCEVMTASANLPAGTYRVFVGVNGFDGVPCDNDSNHYILTLGDGGTPGCPADFNGDGFVDFFDFNDYVDCFDGIFCLPGTTADFNGDGFVDFFDFNDFTDAFEAGC
ncbi:MAG: hypothetical protein HRU70_00890 [Phycisphaeraceae bacterium]|nr:MAG: hypothetical protein HRU70_00890 [Phycisphaeraceae bacterium]